MTTTDATVFYLGNFTTNSNPDLDPDGTGAAEGAGNFVGKTYQSSELQMTTITYEDGNSDGFIDFDEAPTAGNDYVSYTVDGGGSEGVDQAAWMDVTIVTDSGTINTSALVFQTPSGETFLTEFSAPLDNLNVQSIQFTGVNNQFFGRMATNNSVDGTVVCFAAGTRILGENGPGAVDDLRCGDQVRTADAGLQPIHYIHRTRLRCPGPNAPIMFAPDSLGPGVPDRTLALSPQHRVLCRSKLVGRMFAVDEILLPAKRFIGMPGVTQAPPNEEVLYYHLECPEHHILLAEGAEVESCLWAQQTAKTINRFLGAIRRAPSSSQACRIVPKGSRQARFVQRLAATVHPVQTPIMRAKSPEARPGSRLVSIIQRPAYQLDLET